jgi:hypothetical protein
VQQIGGVVWVGVAMSWFSGIFAHSVRTRSAAEQDNQQQASAKKQKSALRAKYLVFRSQKTLLRSKGQKVYLI